MSLIAFFSHVLKAQWTINVPEQNATFEHQTVIITGANCGLGLETAKYMLLHRAAKVIIACRSTTKGEAAKKLLEDEHKIIGVLQVWELDLASYDSIRAFVAKAITELDRLDVLICNAGINNPKYEAVNGFEAQIAINVLSTFLLSFMLLPKLKQTAKDHAETTPHLAIVSSDTHMAVTLDKQHRDKATPILKQLSKKGRFANPLMYPTTKLIEILLVQQLVKHVGEDYPVIINTMNPGLCYSNLGRGMPSVVAKLNNIIFHARDPEVGVKSYIYGVSGGRETHGKYITDASLNGPFGVGMQGPVAEEIGQRLWKELIAELEKVEPSLLSRL